MNTFTITIKDPSGRTETYHEVERLAVIEAIRAFGIEAIEVEEK